MNTVRIERLFNKKLFAKAVFKKACVKNQRLCVNYLSAYAINLHPSSKQGEHWIAVYFDRHGKGKYFDSYGMSPSVRGFTAFTERNSKKWV